MSGEDDKLIPGIELTQWREGRVLNAADIDILNRYLREVDEDEEHNLDLWQQAEHGILMEIGGEELVQAWETRQLSTSWEAVQKALAKYYSKLSAVRSTAS